jgi:hypothetical protein
LETSSQAVEYNVSAFGAVMSRKVAGGYSRALKN